MQGSPVEFDPEKSARNRELRGLPFEMVERFEWRTALVGRDARRDYGDERLLALGQIDGDLYNLVFTMRGEAIRVISLRRANQKERRLYGQGA